MTTAPLVESKAVWTVPRQPAALTAFKVTGVAVSGALFVSLLVRIAVGLSAGTSAWLVLPAFLLGYFFADLVSGTAHWFCDTFFEEDTPVIGKIVIRPFRDHHVHPQRITCYRFIEQDTTNFLLMLPPLAVAFWIGAPWPGSVGALFWCCCLLGLATGSFGTNLFHKWAHAEKPPVVGRWLQRAGLVLGSARHQRHHRDYSRGFCVTSGWMNPLLDALRFLAISEFPKWRKYLILLSFLDNSSARPVQIGGVDVNICHSRVDRSPRTPAVQFAIPSAGAILSHTDGPCGS